MTAHLDSMATAILAALAQHPGVTVLELASASGFTAAQVRQTIYRYEERGNIDSDRTVTGERYWLVTPRRNPAYMVILDILQRGPRTRRDLRDTTGLSKSSVCQSLTLLESQGRIRVLSDSRPFRYALPHPQGHPHAQEDRQPV